MDPFIGQIIMFAGNFAPRGWALCNGQLLSIAQNTALFSILGTTYGGDGRVTFGLPDLRGRVPIHPGQGPGLSNYVLGEQGGTESVTLLSTQIPAHFHTFAPGCTGDPPGSNDPTGCVPAALDNQSYSGNATATMKPGNTGTAGGNQPHSNIQPFNCVNYLIATTGIFPSRN